MRALIKNFSFWKLIYCQRGATAVEYGLILALVCLAVIGAMSDVANKTVSMWDDVANEVLAH